MRRSASEKMEIIKIVSESEIGPTRTLEELGISRSTFYEWYDRYLKHGFDGLLPKTPLRRSFWNKIPEEERQKVVEIALDHAELTPRELAHKITDEKQWYISESSVYRILKERGLITSPAWIVMSAADEFKDKTTGPNQLWQTDFTYMKIVGWGWYYLATVIDDYSRYIVHWELCKYQKKEDAERVVRDAVIKSGLPPNKRPKLLSDNGPCYIASGFDEYLAGMGVKHIRGRKLHPQTQGKIERYHRTMKNVIKLENYYFPEELEQRIKEFVNYYNNERYHESINNVTPADAYYRRDKEILRRRKIIKTKTLAERKINNQIAC
ncbi:MAG: Fis family transcriptional regulator [Bacteroidetes bacterium GWF2_38_335]|nr:MAG: Fis family transcriptional regulator [Bacteroidetes bacterium GWF2_38_335]OFY80356.1 MAG: Fis family transcriptional regulator [Bacteroidetes bacterium RIFOXYA12_FULL_38_20]